MVLAVCHLKTAIVNNLTKERVNIMGTANFSYNEKFGLKILRTADFDLEAENKTREECGLEPIGADDYEWHSDIIYQNICEEVSNIRELMNTQRPKTVMADGRKICVYMNSFESGRVYDAMEIGRVSVELWRYGFNVCLSADLIYRSGYYEGANIDADNFDLNGYDYDFSLENDLENYAYYLSDCLTDKQIAKMWRDKTSERDLEALESVLFSEINTLLKPFCNDYSCVAQLCNGEAWYS